MEFSDGVSLPGYCCSYEIQTDGTIIYAYKKGWYFIYYPSEDALSVHCGANTDSMAVGYYHPTSGNRVSESDEGSSSEDHYSVTREHWENSERAALTLEAEHRAERARSGLSVRFCYFISSEFPGTTGNRDC